MSTGYVSAQLPANLNLDVTPILDTEKQRDAGIAGTQSGPDINISPASKNYGNVVVGSSSSQTFLVSSTGTESLVITSVQAIGANPDQFALVGSMSLFPPPYTLSPGVTIGVKIEFSTDYQALSG